MGVELGVVVQNRGPNAIENVRTLPPFHESLGFHSTWFTDHVAGVRSFQPVYGPEWAECLTSLAFAAARTTHIRLGIGVLVAPYRDPVMAAKMLVTLDGLSDGRLNVGIGTGWSRSEFHALGRGDLFEARGRYTDEAVAVMARCFEGGEFGWEGEFVNFRRMEPLPLPVQRPHPPLWVGGQSGAGLRRAAKWADVWHPTRLKPDEIASMGAELDERAGRTIPRSVRIPIPVDMEVAALVDELAEYNQAGCVEVVMELHTEDTQVAMGWAEKLAAAYDLTPAP